MLLSLEKCLLNICFQSVEWLEVTLPPVNHQCFILVCTLLSSLHVCPVGRPAPSGRGMTARCMQVYMIIGIKGRAIRLTCINMLVRPHL